MQIAHNIEYNQPVISTTNGTYGSITMQLQSALNNTYDSIELNKSVIEQMKEKGAKPEEYQPLTNRLEYLNRVRLELYERYVKSGGTKRLKSWIKIR